MSDRATIVSDRAATARDAAAGLRRFAATAASTDVMIGFDGFVDSIIQVVNKRQEGDAFLPMKTIGELGQRILAAAGQSANIELVVTMQKLGGNGPIMANAMASAGLKVTYVGGVGLPSLHPVFQELADHAEVHSIAQPGFTDALEFNDGKVMLGKLTQLGDVNQEQINKLVGEKAFADIIARSSLVGMVNWTMLPNLETIWTALGERVLPKAKAEVDGRRRMIFVDLADPEKRTTADLQHALSHLTRLNRHADVILGMNLKESGQVAAALGVAVDGDPEAEIESTARKLREKLDVFGVVVHPRRGAAAAVRTDDGQVGSGIFHGPFVAEPKLSTGAGDNFNAGFCLGQLAGLGVEQALCVGTATSGYYVRQAASPTLDQLAAFCDDLPDPQ